jgi:Zn-dependent M28 family amino/carboxypeptidase
MTAGWQCRGSAPPNRTMAKSPSPPLQRRLQADLALLARPRHSQWDPLGLLAVRALIKERLGALGDVREEAFTRGSVNGVNLILALPGRQPELSPLLVGAHYDGPPQSPGADDNATGVAVLLELARRWRAQPPQRPVWLVAFDQEERGPQGGCLGSRVLAEQLRHQGQALHLMVSLEMLGFTSASQRYPLAAMRWLYGSRGDFLALVANLATLPLLPGLARRLGRHVPTKVLPVPLHGLPLPATRRSDHSSFWDQGYNALMATDTSYLRNPHYHQPSDTLATLDLPFLAAVCEGLVEGLGSL